MKMTHLLFWVQENKLSEKFYKKLGFSVLRSDDSHSIVALDNCKITLVSMRDEALFARDLMSSEKGKGVYVYFYVEDVDGEYQRQLQVGLKPATKPRNWDWGNREFILKDPDGYKLCFWHEI